MRFDGIFAIIRKGRGRPLAGLVAALVTLATAAVSWAGAPALQRITQSYEGGRPLSGAYDGTPSVSADGRYVAFVSDALDYAPVVPGTRNVFVKDRLTGSLELVNRTLDDRPASGATNPAISADGRYVAFASEDSALVAGDTNGVQDVFIRDRLLNTIERVSIALGGGVANHQSGRAVAISGDGRYVGFTSLATNLVAGDSNDRLDAFVWDREAGIMERVSAEATGVADFSSLVFSSDGRYVVYSGLDPARGSQSPGYWDLLVCDRETHIRETVNVSSDEELANSGSDYPSISADGRYVVFSSNATNLAPGGLPFNNNIYLRDRLNGTTSLVSYSSDDNPGLGTGDRGAISADGRLIVFTSYSPMVPGPLFQTANLFVRELASGDVWRVDVSTPGTLADWPTEALARPALSADGRYICFESHATNLDPADQCSGVDLFVRDLTGHTTTLVSNRADGGQGLTGAESGDAVISADGSTVAFRSNAQNLVPNDQNHAWDVFVTTRTGEAPELISVSTDGVQAEQSPSPFVSWSEDLAISGDGRFVAFVSAASNLVGDDHNNTWDVFVRDRLLQTTVRADVSSDGVEANGSVTLGGGRSVAISADGRYVAFSSQATNLVPGDTNNTTDLFVRDLVVHTTERVSRSTDGAEANAPSQFPSLSADGRFVVFGSLATNLVPGNTEEVSDLYVRDRQTQTTERVSVTSSGARIKFEPQAPAISGNGRYVVFASDDPDVVPGDTNGAFDVFVRDLVTHTTERVSLSSDGTQLTGDSRAPSISDDGRFVGFRKEFTSGDYSLQIRDRLRNTTERVDVNGDGSNWGSPYLLGQSRGAISADGHYVSFMVSNPALDPARPCGNVDVFVRTRGSQAVAPASLTAAVEDGQIRLNWVDRSDDETGFRIERRTEGEAFQVLVTRPAGSSNYLDTAIQEGVIYTYRVIALSPYGDSLPSNEASASVPTPLPQAPSGLTATALSQNSIRLDWADASQVETGFTIQWSSDGGKIFSVVAEVGANVETYNVDGLLPNKTFSFRVRATNAFGSSPWAGPVTATTLPNPPTAPGGFSVSLVSDTELRLIWNSVNHDEAGFHLERKGPGSSFQPVGDFPAGSTGYIDSGLEPDQSYAYRLRTFNAGGVSDWVERSYATGAIPTGKLQIAKKLDFGSVKVGKVGSKNLRVRNGSKQDALRFSVDAPDAPYSLANPTTQIYVTRRGLRDVWVNFRPTSKGKKTVKVRVVSSDPKQPDLLITLTGRGK